MSRGNDTWRQPWKEKSRATGVLPALVAASMTCNDHRGKASCAGGMSDGIIKWEKLRATGSPPDPLQHPTAAPSREPPSPLVSKPIGELAPVALPRSETLASLQDSMDVTLARATARPDRAQQPRRRAAAAPAPPRSPWAEASRRNRSAALEVSTTGSDSLLGERVARPGRTYPCRPGRGA